LRTPGVSICRPNPHSWCTSPVQEGNAKGNGRPFWKGFEKQASKCAK